MYLAIASHTTLAGTYLHLAIGLDETKESSEYQSRDIRQGPTEPKEGQRNLKFRRFENRQNQSKRRGDLGACQYMPL
jgi:hypothetical protein